MFGKKRQRELAREQERERREAAFKRRESEGRELYGRVVGLSSVDRAKLENDALILFKDAQRQVALIRQSIADRTGYDFDTGESFRDGDLATSLAEDAVGMTRENTTNPQTVYQALSDQLPDVQFTVDWYDASSMIAAELRLERIHGVLQGLQIAGVINPD